MSNESKQPLAQVWLNVGIYIPHPNEGEPDIFVSTPVGIPLDTSKILPTASKNEIWAYTQKARNQLRAQLINRGLELKPGEAIPLPKVKVELRRTKDSATLEDEADEVVLDLF